MIERLGPVQRPHCQVEMEILRRNRHWARYISVYSALTEIID